MEIVQSFWYKGKLSPYEEMCLKSFIFHGHKFILYSYETINVPDGVELRDASLVIPESNYFCYKSGPGQGSPSAFSNRFRYELLLNYGQWWVDTDVICMSDKLPENTLVYAYQDVKHINGAVLKIPRSHSLAFELCSESKLLGDTISWGQAGPHLITRLVKQNNLEMFCLPTNTIYPLSYDEALEVLRPAAIESVNQKCSEALFIHLWNEILRRSAIRKDISPPAESFLGKLFKKFSVPFPSGLEYTEREIEFINTNSFINRWRLQKKYEALQQMHDDLTIKYNGLADIFRIDSAKDLQVMFPQLLLEYHRSTSRNPRNTLQRYYRKIMSLLNR